LRAEREKKGLSQRELGRLMNQHHNYVNECESGERQLNIIELKEWCEALELNWIDFVRELDEALTPNT
jgi:transcriptional regulator with XRE-family HTH domain